VQYPEPEPEPAEEMPFEPFQVAQAGPARIDLRGMAVPDKQTGATPRINARTGRPITGPSMSDITEPAMGMLNMGAATVKGAVQGFAGLPGDVEALSYGIKELFNRGAGEGKIDAFLRGMSEQTIMPRTDEIRKWLDTNVGTVAGGENPYETIGEVVAPAGQIKAAKAAVKGVAKGAKALAPKAGEMIENYLTKTGAILKVAPDAPAIEVPVAGDITKPAFKRWFGASKVADDQGQPIVVYHQTSKAAEPVIMREGFRADKPMARRNDEQVPDGLFFKPTDTDIGVGTSNKADRTQIPVYLSLKNPLVVKDRSQITELINDPEYTRLAKIYDDLDKSLAAEFDAKWNDKEFMKNDAAWDAFSEQWQKRVDTEQPAAAAVARQRLTQVLKERGYDGMIIEKDAGSANRSTKTYIALEPTQVKSIFNKGTWNPNDPRILQGAGGVTATGAATQDKENK